MRLKGLEDALVPSSRADVLNPCISTRFHCKISSIVMQHFRPQLLKVSPPAALCNLGYVNTPRYGLINDLYDVGYSFIHCALLLVSDPTFSQHSVELRARSQLC